MPYPLLQPIRCRLRRCAALAAAPLKIVLAPLAVIALAIAPSSALGARNTAAPTLHDAVESAWARHPAARALTARREEFAARRDGADSLLSGSPTATLSNRSDRLHRNDGQREWEGGIALPLWLPGYQARTLALIEREQEAFDALVAQARWRLAGEVREAWWQTQLADNERAVARTRTEAARQLVDDVERRIHAGDLPRMDGNQAHSALAVAEAAMADAETRAHRATRAFLALTGWSALPPSEGMDERRARIGNSEALPHPQLAPLERAIAAARARLDIATKNVRDLPELTLGLRRERPLNDAAWDSSAIIAVRIPLATDARNRPKIAAANADLIEAEALLPYEQTRVDAERDVAERELDRAAATLTLAETRGRLAAEMRHEYARSFALGNIDLPQRLRVEAEAFDADLALARARIEAARAVSRYNQALGVLP